jgi:hypothetical protein
LDDERTEESEGREEESNEIHGGEAVRDLHGCLEWA